MFCIYKKERTEDFENLCSPSSFLLKKVYRRRTFDIFIAYLDGPVFVEQGQNVTRDNGARIELKCEADSNPEADLTWYKLPDISKVWLSTIRVFFL